MKGLLYKNFASSKALLLFFAGIFLVSAVYGLFLDEMRLPFSVDIYMIYAVIVIVRSISDSDKSSWEDYSRSLPCKPYQRVGSRYLFCLIVFVAVFVAFAAMAAIERLWGQNVNFGEKLLSWCKNELTIYLHYLLIFVFSTSFVLPVSYAMKRSGVRSLIMGAMYLPPFAALFSLVLTDALGGYDGLTETVLSLEFAGIFAVVAFSAFAASFCFSLIAETKTEKEKLKYVKVCAAALTALAVAFSGAAVGLLYEKGALIRNAEWGVDEPSDLLVTTEPVPSVSYDFEEIEKNKQEINDAFARPLMNDILDKICGRTFVDGYYRDAKNFFAEAGFEEYIYKSAPGSDKTFFIQIVEKTTERNFFAVSVSADVMPAVIAYPDSWDAADDADKKHAEIMDLFHIGTEEKEAVEHMKRLGLCPYSISEAPKNGVPMRTYRMEIQYYSEYKQAKKPTVTLEFDVINGRISDVR